MHTVCMLLSAAATINAWTAPTKAVHKLRVPPRRDEDRCFYGEVGVDGSVVRLVAEGGAHHQDLRFSSELDAPDVHRARAAARAHMTRWLAAARGA